MVFYIDHIKIKNPVLLAPMSGVSDFPFRKLVNSFGTGLVVSEMIASRAMVLQTKQSLQKCTKEKGGQPTSVQLAGCDAEVIAEAAKLNEDLGADIIDLNFGCPVKKVVGGNAGSALMKNEKLATDILKATVKAVNIPVTLKMRMGWDQNSLNAPKLAKIAEDNGIKMIVVHGRTRAQLYNGKADWDFIGKIKKVIKIPLIANGDIRTYDDAEEALSKSNADGIMIGRGCYGKPWLIRDIIHYLKTKEKASEPTIVEKREIIRRHFNDMLDHYEKEIVAIRLYRKHLGWYSNGLKNSAEFRSKLNKLTKTKDIFNIIDEFFN